MYPEISNFIVVRTTWKSFFNMDVKKWDDMQEKFLTQYIKQISKLYPGSKIHVITDDKDRKSYGNVVFHHKDPIPGHLIKLYAYSLLDEPAMYTDTDIIFMSKFTNRHLICSGNFNVYNRRSYETKELPLQQFSDKKLPCDVEYHYNAGVIWIPEPDKKVTDSLFNMHYEYFSNNRRIAAYGGCENSDEYPLALYIAQNRLGMNICNDVCKNRAGIDWIDREKYQSLHYTFVELEKVLNIKSLCFKEYKKLNVFM
ncbi:MAG: hypothetical protein ACW99G_03525 [Candidatus Thorarchaeota archaeon]|jgi:hypothetical protein